MYVLDFINVGRKLCSKEILDPQVIYTLTRSMSCIFDFL